jgi:hypothetical protein
MPALPHDADPAVHPTKQAFIQIEQKPVLEPWTGHWQTRPAPD